MKIAVADYIITNDGLTPLIPQIVEIHRPHSKSQNQIYYTHKNLHQSQQILFELWASH